MRCFAIFWKVSKLSREPCIHRVVYACIYAYLLYSGTCFQEHLSGKERQKLKELILHFHLKRYTY